MIIGDVGDNRRQLASPVPPHIGYDDELVMLEMSIPVIDWFKQYLFDNNKPASGKKSLMAEWLEQASQ